MTPCIQCGKCCREEVCQIGEMAAELLKIPIRPPCPFLMEKNTSAVCSIVVTEEKEYPNFVDRLVSRSLGIGLGCSYDKNQKIG